MPIRQFRPITASSRFRSVADFSEITRVEPEKSLVEPLKKSGGRDNHGHISMRRRGGGHKRKYRIIDFRRDKFAVTATVRMPSTEMRMIHGRCLATIGVVGNEEHELLSWGKAGKARWKGRRPRVRGEVMNPVDHPHGGRTRGGRNVVSPWGKKEGVKTRNTKKHSQKLLVRGRKRGKATQ